MDYKKFHIAILQNLAKQLFLNFMVNKQIVKVSETDYNHHGNYANTNLNKNATTIETVTTHF